VPPKITPSIRLGIRFKLINKDEKRVTIIVVAIKLRTVKYPDFLKEFNIILKSKEHPLSKRITTKAIVVTTSPIFPKSLGEINCRYGPIIIPNNIKIRTSGINVFLNIKLKACAANIKTPTDRITWYMSFQILK
jgi:hypothetical protein